MQERPRAGLCYFLAPMKASYRWLRELVPQLQATPRELADRLTSAGLEIEGLTELGAATDACLVARVVAIRPHPTKSGSCTRSSGRAGSRPLRVG